MVQVVNKAAAKEYQWMLEQLDAHRVRPSVRKWILKAYDSTEWDWHKDCDGCTGVCEIGIPRGTGYKSIPCVLHDYLRRFWVKVGKMSVGRCDELFRQAMEDFGWHPAIKWVRWFAVRYPAWWFWFKWRQSGKKPAKQEKTR
jgi:hypothetical protein